MIQKIEKIISIGKFRDYEAKGDVALKKLSLIYAENGCGKTTLASILRSLTGEQSAILTKRVSIKAANPQYVKIIQRSASGDTHHTFNQKGWTIGLPGIEIFDIHFINDNVYSGFEFNEDQKKQLHQFIIGAQGVEIQASIETNKIHKSDARKKLSDLEDLLTKTVSNGLTADRINAYISIKKESIKNIDDQIQKSELALKNANSNEIIQSFKFPSVLRKLTPNILFDSLINDLRTDNQTIQENAIKELFKSHCSDLNNNGVNGPENWLKIGFDYYGNKKNDTSDGLVPCPFCNQSISDSLEIIKAYSIKFNVEFNALVRKIHEDLKSLEAFNLDSTIQQFNHACEINTNCINPWIGILPENIPQPIFNLIENVDELKAEYSEIISLFQMKSQNPTIALPTDAIEKFQKSIQRININIDAHNEQIKKYNEAITTFKSSIPEKEKAQKELNTFKCTKLRFNDEINQICNDITTAKANIKSLESTYTRLVQKQEEAAKNFFNDYKDRINYYLKTVFRTNIEIEDVLHIPPQGRAIQSKISYKLKIDGHELSFDPNLAYNVKDSLSEGDKSTIALALFLSKLDIDPNRKEKILVFDDPLSSLDSNRRIYTVQTIQNLLQSIKQIIVLSHNENFLFQLSRNISVGDRKFLRITEDSLMNTSIIENLDLDSLVENDYFKHVKELEAFVQRPDINQKERVTGLMRNVLEAHIRFKFHRQTKDLSPNSRTFGNLIIALNNKGVKFRDDANRLDIFQKLNLINSISSKPHHGEPIPDFQLDGSKLDTITVGEIINLVKDTLSLIDDRL